MSSARGRVTKWPPPTICSGRDSSVRAETVDDPCAVVVVDADGRQRPFLDTREDNPSVNDLAVLDAGGVRRSCRVR